MKLKVDTKQMKSEIDKIKKSVDNIVTCKKNMNSQILRIQNSKQWKDYSGSVVKTKI